MDDVRRHTLLQEARDEIRRLTEPLQRWPGICVYCGDDADSRDHLAARASSGEHQVMVPACLRCNTLLGAFPVASVSERAEHIRLREMSKNRRLLAGVHHDIDNYGWALGSALSSRMARRAFLHRRLRNLAVGGIGSSRFEPVW